MQITINPITTETFRSEEIPSVEITFESLGGTEMIALKAHAILSDAVAGELVFLIIEKKVKTVKGFSADWQDGKGMQPITNGPDLASVLRAVGSLARFTNEIYGKIWASTGVEVSEKKTSPSHTTSEQPNTSQSVGAVTTVDV